MEARREDLRVAARPREIRGLDGLRALAIVAVLVFHLRPASLTGGFLGVDVFFVVSGFLITTLLLREITARGRLNLAAFWKRRARRLVPALALVVVASVSAGLVIGQDLLVGIGRQALGALTFSSNWLEIAAGSSYFANTSPQLFANFWSLAVEEQFYLFWPVLFALFLALLPTWRKRIMVALGFAVASGVAMAVLAVPGEDATRVYYGTDTHAFGLLLGVTLAFLWATESFLDSNAWRRLAPLAGPASLAGLVALMVVLDENHVATFRGGLLAGSLLTAVLIASLLPGTSPLLHLLEVRPVAWLGQRSYGIYLWHWPLILIVTALMPAAAPDSVGEWTNRGLALGLTLAISAASFHHLETPVRKHGFRGSARLALRALAGPILVPKLATGLVAILGVLTVAGIATAPEKSAAQQAIETGQVAIEVQAGGRPSPVATPTGADDGVAPPVQGNAEDPAEDPAEPPATVDPDLDLTMPTGEEISTFGDSLIVTSTHALQDRFPGIHLDALSNSQWKHAEGTLGAALEAGTVRRAVVLDYGTNAGVSDPDVVRRVLDMLGPERLVVVVNLHSRSTFIESSNRLLTEVVAEYPNAIIADWNTAISAEPELLQADRTHPGIFGAHLFADTVKAAFERLTGGN
ncbi:MAG: acyltransferase family protein [Actinomycetota bacterium]